MFSIIKKYFKKKVKVYLLRIFPSLKILEDPDINWRFIKNSWNNSKKGIHVKIYPPFHIDRSSIEDYTYIAQNSYINNSKIGKFCSIGPNLICGWGMHPTNGISTHPMFYSTLKQNGTTLSKLDKVDELKHIKIGNDVFIGANVTILNGISIGDGAVIGAGAVVSKDIPSYAIAVGVPIHIKRYRFDEKIISKLSNIKWWDFDEMQLENVEKYFFDVTSFIRDFRSNV